jgi:hypothetical protein
VFGKNDNWYNFLSCWKMPPLRSIPVVLNFDHEWLRLWSRKQQHHEHNILTHRSRCTYYKSTF